MISISKGQWISSIELDTTRQAVIFSFILALSRYVQSLAAVAPQFEFLNWVPVWALGVFIIASKVLVEKVSEPTWSALLAVVFFGAIKYGCQSLLDVLGGGAVIFGESPMPLAFFGLALAFRKFTRVPVASTLVLGIGLFLMLAVSEGVVFQLIGRSYTAAQRAVESGSMLMERSEYSTYNSKMANFAVIGGGFLFFFIPHWLFWFTATLKMRSSFLAEKGPAVEPKHQEEDISNVW